MFRAVVRAFARKTKTQNMEDQLQAAATERDTLRRQFAAMTADCDRLQRELQGMTQHASELVAHADTLRAQRDHLQAALAQQTDTKPVREEQSEHVDGGGPLELSEYTPAVVAALIDDRKNLQQQLTTMTAYRDALCNNVAFLSAQVQKQTARAQSFYDSEQAQKARAETAELALATMTQRRDALSHELYCKTLECDALRNTTTHRDELQPELRSIPKHGPPPTPKSQPVEICKGIWRTRSGREFPIRQHGNSWRYQGENGSALSWYTSGAYSDDAGEHPLDLVAYVGPLPEAAPKPEPEPTLVLQPVQVRPGIWKTRSGREVEVRERYSLTRFRWVGVLLGINESWRDDGQWSVKNETNHRDLVQYVRPLPEPEPLPEQTTTDTLTQIEGQIAAMSDVAEDVGGVELRALAYAAKIDNLQQQLATMTAERDQWIASHDMTLRRQLDAMTAERNAIACELEALRGRECSSADVPVVDPAPSPLITPEAQTIIVDAFVKIMIDAAVQAVSAVTGQAITPDLCNHVCQSIGGYSFRYTDAPEENINIVDTLVFDANSIGVMSADVGVFHEGNSNQ